MNYKEAKKGIDINKRTPLPPTPPKPRWKDFGWTPKASDLTSIPKEYKIEIISNRLKTVIHGLMPDNFSFKIGSEWVPFLPATGQLGIVNQLSQLLTGTQMTTALQSRRIWKGTSPININLVLKFQSITNTLENVIYPIYTLLALASPEESDGVVPWLQPPGPGPFDTDVPTNPYMASVVAGAKEVAKGLTSGEKISLNIGTRLRFPSVIIKEVTPTFEGKIDSSGWFTEASVSINFETYEIITKNKLNQVFFGKKG